MSINEVFSSILNAFLVGNKQMDISFKLDNSNSPDIKSISFHDPFKYGDGEVEPPYIRISPKDKAVFLSNVSSSDLRDPFTQSMIGITLPNE